MPDGTKKQDPFDALMVEAFPEGVPEPEAVVIGGAHSAYHLLEALVQVYDMLGAYAELNEIVDAQCPGWAVLQEYEGRFVDGMRATLAPDWAILDADVYVERFDQAQEWISETAAGAGQRLAEWLAGHGIPRVFLWVHAEGHGMVPFLMEAADPEATGPMKMGAVPLD